MKKIESIKVKAILDECPDTSFIGEYTDEYDDWHIDRREGEYVAILKQTMPDYEPPQRGLEFRFFKPYAGGEKPGSADYEKYGKQDYDRIEGLNNGDWNYIGIEAEAIVSVSTDGKSWKMDKITSGGLWGIESDSGNDHLKEVALEQLSELKTILEEYGFTGDQFDAANDFEDASDIIDG